MIIVNPSSGAEHGQEMAGHLVEVLSDKYEHIDIRKTTDKEDVVFYSNQALEEQYDLLFLLGGDGTIRQGMATVASSERRPVFGVIPMGTVNNFSRMLNMPQDPQELLEKLPQAQVKEVDIARINDDYFISSLSFGSLPAVVRDVSAKDKAEMGSLAYAKGILEEIGDQETHHFEMVIDGEELAGEYTAVIVGVGNSMGGFSKVFAESDLQSGFLSFVGLKASTVTEILSLLPKLFKEEDTYEGDLIDFRQFQKAYFKSPQVQMDTTIDGDKGPSLPVEVEIMAGHMQCLYIPEDDNGFF